MAITHATSTTGPVLTASVGGATATRGAPDTALELLEAADAQLYQAKAAGRNRVAWCTAAGGG